MTEIDYDLLSDLVAEKVARRLMGARLKKLERQAADDGPGRILGEWISPREVRERFSVSRRTLFDWRRQGLVRTRRFGRVVRVHRRDVERVLQQET